MLEVMGESYLWIKALHVVSVISWMAGLLYLPRLFVYHSQVASGSEASELFKIMERRLLRAIMYPAMGASWILGILLLLELGDFRSIWVWIKLGAAVGLVMLHLMMAKWRLDFAQDRNRHSEKFYRVINEFPTMLMIIIVVFAVVKPL